MLIFGLYGGLKKSEYLNLKVTDVSTQGCLLLVNIPKAKSDNPRSFIIPEKDTFFVKKYMSLRPKKAKSDRFFLRYQMGKCVCQVIGIHKFESIPREIASYLNLKNVQDYTTHAFWRTSSSGGDNSASKRYAGWNSDAVVQCSIEESVEKETATAGMINSFIKEEFPVDDSARVMKRNFYEEILFSETSASDDQQPEIKKEKLSDTSDEDILDSGVTEPEPDYEIPVLAKKRLSDIIEKGAVFHNCTFNFS